MRYLTLSLGLAWLLAFLPAAAPAQEPPAQQTQDPQAQGQPGDPQTPQTTDQKIEELDQKIRVLDRKIELDKEAAAEKAKATGGVTADKNGFSIKSADGAYRLRVGGYVQFDSRFFLDDKQKPNIDTFTLRRVRPILEGTVAKIFDFRIMTDFGGGQTVLQDAYLEGRFNPAFRVRAGKFKPPVGLERLQSGADLLFVERSLPTNLVPNRDLGVQIAGDLAGGIASYQLGVFNGVVDGGIADADTNSEKDVAARLFFQPFIQAGGPLKSLGFGIAGTSGDQSGTAAAPGLPSYKSPGQVTVFSYRSDGTAANTTIASGSHVRIVPQAYLYSGPFGLLAEYASSRQDVTRGTVSRELDHRSWQAAASWVITGGVPTYRAVDPKVVFDPAAHTWGAWEIKVRYSKLDIDPATFPVFANPASAIRSESALAAGLNWYLNRNVRLLFDYERTKFDGGFTTGDREDEKIFFSRFQIQF
ncbi:MAG TPA: porin [Thermoanaerobaculia bacterium]|nr:porin [Thermoanaerobaculia bacterium]